MLLQAHVSLTRSAQAQERNLLDARQHGIERIEVRKQACRRLCADARYAWNVVDSIARQREKIGDLIGAHAEAALDAGGIPAFVFGKVPLFVVGADHLAEILVGRNDDGTKTLAAR